jgi:hypothetical protein
MTHPYGDLTIAEVKEWIQNLLDTNDLAVGRALLVIFERQTDNEKSADRTEDKNDIGFSGVDAEICSSFAKQYKSRGFLSPKQMVIARKKMKKYWKQLAEIAREKGNLPKSLPKKSIKKVIMTSPLADKSPNQRMFNLATY